MSQDLFHWQMLETQTRKKLVRLQSFVVLYILYKTKFADCYTCISNGSSISETARRKRLMKNIIYGNTYITYMYM